MSEATIKYQKSDSIHVTGSQILKGISKLKKIQVSDIPSGLYILIIEKQGKTQRFKLLKK